MKKNMALGDRILRFILAVLLIVLFFTTDTGAPWKYVMITVASIFMLTAYLGSCPLYSLFGIDTRQFKEADHIKP
jgi:hypothetical protein